MSSGLAYRQPTAARFLTTCTIFMSEPPQAPEVREVCRSLDLFEDVLAADEGDGLAGRLAPEAERVAVTWPERLEGCTGHAEPVVVRFPAAAAVPGLLVCAATGAGVSALVFHDRVLQLLGVWTR